MSARERSEMMPFWGTPWWSMPPDVKERARIKISQARVEDNNPNWKGENVAISTVIWRARTEVRQSFQLKPCQLCGNPKSERHHRDGDIFNNTEQNIGFFCRRCHMIIDGRLEKRDSSGKFTGV